MYIKCGFTRQVQRSGDLPRAQLHQQGCAPSQWIGRTAHSPPSQHFNSKTRASSITVADALAHVRSLLWPVRPLACGMHAYSAWLLPTTRGHCLMSVVHAGDEPLQLSLWGRVLPDQRLEGLQGSLHVRQGVQRGGAGGCCCKRPVGCCMQDRCDAAQVLHSCLAAPPPAPVSPLRPTTLSGLLQHQLESTATINSAVTKPAARAVSPPQF
jgi:hypothetical protein